MSIDALSKVYHYWDHERGIISPTVGGEAVFTRSGSAWCPMIENIFRTLPVNTPRETPEGLLIEKGQTNLVDAPLDPDSNDLDWVANSGLSRLAAVSLFDGETASRYLNNDTSSTWQAVYQSFLSAHANTKHVCAWLVEQHVSDTVRFGFENLSLSTWYAYADFTFSTESYSGLTGTSSDLEAGVYKVRAVGPNGGKVMLCWVAASASSGSHNARLYAYGTQGTAPGTTLSEGIILHGVSFVEDSHLTSIIDGTRAVEDFYWPTPPVDFLADGTHTGYCLYLRYQVVKHNSVSNQMLVFIGETFGERMHMQIRSDGDYRYRIITSGSSSMLGDITLSPLPVSGDVVELVIYYDNADSNPVIRFTGRVVGGTPVGTSSGTGSVTTSLEDWGSAGQFYLGREADGSERGAAYYRQVKLVAANAIASAVDGTDDDGLIDEMGRLYVSPDASRVVPYV